MNCRMLGVFRLSLIVLSLSIAWSRVSYAESTANSNAELWKIIYKRNPDLKEYGKEYLEWLHGAKLYVIDDEGPQPKQPEELKGRVWHAWPTGKEGDENWVRSQERDEPALRWYENYDRWIEKGTKGFEKLHLGDKWDEFVFLNKVSPELTPERTFRMSDMQAPAFSEAEMAKIEESAKKLMKERGVDGEKLLKELVAIEATRRALQDRMGKTILKYCTACGSEGELPKSYKDDWMKTYIDFIEGKDKSQKGEVLEAILKDPREVIAQKMTEHKVEVRLHIIDGKIVPDATFLRFYPLGAYLTDKDRDTIHREVETKFLNKLVEKMGPDFNSFMAAPDVVLTSDGQVKIIDLNVGTHSGYFRTGDDIFTINRLSEHLKGAPTPLLIEWAQAARLPIGSRAKVRRIRELFTKLFPYIEVKNMEAYYDRVLTNYRQLLMQDPTPEKFAGALADLKAIGLKEVMVYAGFVNHVQDTIRTADGKRLRLTPLEASKWAQAMEKFDGNYSVRTFPSGKLDIDYSEAGKKAGAVPAVEACPFAKIAGFKMGFK